MKDFCEVICIEDPNSLGYYLIGNTPPTNIKVAKEE